MFLQVNASPVTSSAPSLNYQMEPPSNQSHHGNYFPALPLEEKVHFILFWLFDSIDFDFPILVFLLADSATSFAIGLHEQL